MEKTVEKDSYEKILKCRRSYHKEWYQRNRERRQQYMRDYRKKRTAELEELRALKALLIEEVLD